LRLSNSRVFYNMMTLQAINSSLKTAKKINQNYSQNLIHILYCIKDNVFTFCI